MVPSDGEARKTVLLVEDEPKLRALMKLWLEEHGYRILEAHRGDAALSLVQQEHPDLILLDVCLPGAIDGLQTYHRLKGKASTRRIPVIFVTATAPKGTVAEKQLPLGEQCVVFGKPFEPKLLLEQMDRLLSQAVPADG